ncbi:MAG: peptide ABC transporter permease [Rhodospirillales bacterium RIFCSPLOWO2_12_FULL_58_28]|nr:MAG: peptide ABC transporter permease [Rhodospirillales bacterium RIFCSPLOWO2_12_FULL_58_28]
MSDPLAHYVSHDPFDPLTAEKLTPEQERYYMASQFQMMWWRFKRHKLAVTAGVIILLSYFSILITEFLAPYELHSRNTEFIYAPPQKLHMIHEGSLIGPFVYRLDYKLNMETLKREYTEDKTTVYPLRFLCAGDNYRFWGLFKGNLHLVCPAENGTMFLLGADRLGRDIASRLLYGGRISLTVGLLGISISFILGIVIGGIAGYFGGWADIVIQRIIEILRSLPELPLWMALSASLPITWSPILIYLGITVILGLLDWPGLARAVRSKLLALREEDYCSAARLMGARPGRIIGRHLLPNFMSHLIASVTLSVPSMILGETALSFLGLGLRPPVTSWGVLLSEAQNIEAVALYPWLMLPMLPVIITVLGFNFLGDGLRDAADPYN